MELDSYCNGNKFDLGNFLADVMRTKLLSEGYVIFKYLVVRVGYFTFKIAGFAEFDSSPAVLTAMTS